MQTVQKSVIVARPAHAMYALVDDCERYPEFLPWCAGAVVSERTTETSLATLEIDYHGLRSRISTRNRNEPPDFIHLEFVEGPFEHFKGHWHFVPLGDEGCRVEFSLDYSFASRTMEAVLGPVFGHIIETLVDRFVERAQSLPGPAAATA
jgi:ribosome-associated toxin RatA of RatAB toxin-antitoxin module